MGQHGIPEQRRSGWLVADKGLAQRRTAQGAEVGAVAAAHRQRAVAVPVVGVLGLIETHLGWQRRHVRVHQLTQSLVVGADQQGVEGDYTDNAVAVVDYR